MATPPVLPPPPPPTTLPTSTSTTPKFVAEVTLELLHLELVHYIHAQHESKSASSSSATLQALGFSVGRRLTERLATDKRFVETLDLIKFLCKDIWMAAFSKQIDKLRTNHKGTYVLHDFNFRWLSRLSSSSHSTEELTALGARYTDFTCGLLRGSLCALGMESTVSCELRTLPQCLFTIHTLSNATAAPGNENNVSVS
jgi:trafficking protein particle complex subunit 6